MSSSLVKDALHQIRELRGKLNAMERARSEPVAIVGLGCRLPGGADNPDAFWELLAEGRDAVTEVPPDRWSVDAYYDPDPDAPGKMSTRHGAFLTDIDRFDPRFFGISPLEAAALDPQQRLLLEVCWEALEDAACPPDSLLGSATGVFVGIGTLDYALLRARDDRAQDIDAYLALGTSHSVACGRISYVLGLQGPSLSVDTACSSSLVAVHLAVRSLRTGESNLALAGGVGVLLAPDYYINFSKARMLAADGRCKTFDAAADGYVRGEGCGMVVLKRLSDALADGDHIHAVIRGTAVNQDGRSSGLTVPNGPSQEAVIRAALADAGLAAADVDYVEAHGTGTALGDPIEVRALGAVFGEGREPGRALGIGSVKTNIGHLESAAGVAGLIKMVLALERELVPKQLHFRTPNPHVEWERWQIQVVADPRPWPRGPKARVAGISSFGFSGTNAHILLEEAPALEPPSATERACHVVTLSGKSDESLRTAASRLSAHLVAHPELRLGDVAHTANAGRAHFAHRAAVLAHSTAELKASLKALAEGSADTRTLVGTVQEPEAPEVVFLFTGQGSQYAGMGKGLFESAPVFRAELERCANLLTGALERPLLDVIYGPESAPIDQTAYTQPALFAVEYALAAQWRAWGVTPVAVLGHSLGEYVAACVAGALTLEDGLKLVTHRARLMQQLPSGGAMAAVFASVARVEQAMAGSATVSVAAINGPSNVVVAGAAGAVEALCTHLAAEGVSSKRLTVSHAFHSPLVEPMLDAFEAVARDVRAAEPELEIISNLTGEPLRSRDLDARYWRAHARRPVQFQAGVQALATNGYRVFLEIGPAPTLIGLAEACVAPNGRVWLASLRRGRDDWECVLEALAGLHVAGARIDWTALNQGSQCRKVRLPTSPFEREHYWFGAPRDTRTAIRVAGARPWDLCLQATRIQSQQGPFDLVPASFPAKWRALERLTLGYQVRALHELGAFTTPGETYSPAKLCEQYGLASSHARLMDRWLVHLAEVGLVVREGAGFRADRPLTLPELDPLLRDAEAALHDYPEFLDYVKSCGPRLAAVLTGRESPLDTLFPGGSFDLADGLYHRSPVSRYLNAMVREAIQAAARAVPAGCALRVLEIGAGTGGTAAALLPALDPARTAYTFTDVSDLFLDRARERFAAHPCVRYTRLDIDRDPAEQGFAANTFDVIVAANVLHATRDLGATLERVRRLLGAGGLLLLSETTAHPRVFDITTGLIEGWEIFADEMRRDNPLVSAERWVELLLANGFAEAAAFPPANAPASALGNHVIIAATPGAAFAARVSGGSPAEAAVPAGANATRGRRAAEEEREAFLEELRQAVPSERLDLLAQFVRRHVMRVLRLGPENPPDLRARLMDLGLDSLMAVQLRNQLAAGLALARPLSATLVFDRPTCEAIAAYLDREHFERAGETASTSAVPKPVSAPPAADVARTQEFQQMTDEETEALLLRRLQSIAERTP